MSLTTVARADDQTVETVVVTGSRIPQQGLYSSTPVVTVGQDEAKFQGTTNVENLLNNLPSVVADQTDTVSNGASGTASVNLRGLGASRTLVLIDSKRLMPGDADAVSHGNGGVADLNFIPASLVDHIEVLTGGASSTYGSDAMAGVVNFILRKDFEGVEVDGQYSVAQNDNTDDFPKFCAGCGNIDDAFGIKRPQKDIWNGDTEDLHLLLGTNTANGKGNVTIYAGYQHVAKILESTRDFSSCAATTYYTYFGCGGSSTVPEGKFVSIDVGNYNLTHAPLPQTTFATTSRTLTTANPGLFNFAPFNYLQRPDVRYTGGGMGHYEFNKGLDVYASAMFMDDHTLAQIAPGGAFQTPFLVNCDNPLMSAQEEATLCPAGVTSLATGNTFFGNAAADAGNLATVLIGRRTVEAGDRIDDLRHTDYRFVIGAKGDLGNSWSYDVSAQYGVDVYADAQLGNLSASKFQNALSVVDVGGVPTCESVVNQSDVKCVPIDIFQAPVLNAARNKAISSPLTPAMLQYAAVQGLAQGQATEDVVSGSLTGDLGQWGVQSPWAKSPIAVSVGSEYRQETVTYDPDAELINGDLMGLGGARAPVNGAYNVVEGFGEVRIPVVQNMPFFEDLSLNGGYRYSSYNSVGTTNTYKYGFEWQPIDDFRIRGGFARAARAPNVAELFANKDVILFGGQDPCANNPRSNAPPVLTPDLQAFCQASGLVNFGTGGPGDQYGAILPCPASQCNQQIDGNVNLTPEESDTRTIGVVLTPTFLPGFTATIDYWDINVNKFIASLGAATLLENCENNPAGPACGFIHRDPATGFLWTPNGFVVNPTENLGFVRTKGVDVQANYTVDLSDWGATGVGSLSASLNGTYTESFLTEPLPPSSIFFDPTAKTFECVGKYGFQCGTSDPRWRHQLRVTWNTPWDVDLSMQWRYFGHVMYDFSATGPADIVDTKIPAYNWFDLAVNWNVREGVSLRAGVNNIFDKGPPINGIALGNGNTQPGTYDALGRFVFVGGTIKY